MLCKAEPSTGSSGLALTGPATILSHHLSVAAFRLQNTQHQPNVRVYLVSEPLIQPLTFGLKEQDEVRKKAQPVLLAAFQGTGKLSHCLSSP